MSLPWSLRWRSWLWSQTWTYQKLWRDHKVVVFLACLGVAFLLHIYVEHRR